MVAPRGRSDASNDGSCSWLSAPPCDGECPALAPAPASVPPADAPLGLRGAAALPVWLVRRAGASLADASSDAKSEGGPWSETIFCAPASVLSLVDERSAAGDVPCVVEVGFAEVAGPEVGCELGMGVVGAA